MPELRADCSRCLGLCCVVPTFARSADFALDKPAGQPCPHLGADSACSIHARLRQRGFAGCTVYDCFGAGQHLSQVTFGGRDWRADAPMAAAMGAAFDVVRDLHELLWYLDDALGRSEADDLADDLRAAADRVRALTAGSAGDLAAVDVLGHRQRVDLLLTEVSERVRAGAPQPTRQHLRADLVGARLRRADLVGARLRRADLRGALLRGACLIGASLAGADLRRADLLGADLRGVDLSGADLSDTLYLTRPQVSAARGDGATRLPARVERPAHWAGSGAAPTVGVAAAG